MAFDELKQDLTEAQAEIKSYLESSEEYLKLKVFKMFMVSLTAFAHFLAIGAMLLLALFFLSTAASLAIGKSFSDPLYGFLLVGLFYVLAATGIYIFRKRIDRPIIRKFSKYFFEEE